MISFCDCILADCHLKILLLLIVFNIYITILKIILTYIKVDTNLY